MQTQNKRQREQLKLERSKQKDERRATRRKARQEKVASTGNEDPDLAGIVAGPQRLAE